MIFLAEDEETNHVDFSVAFIYQFSTSVNSFEMDQVMLYIYYQETVDDVMYGSMSVVRPVHSAILLTIIRLMSSGFDYILTTKSSVRTECVFNTSVFCGYHFVSGDQR